MSHHALRCKPQVQMSGFSERHGKPMAFYSDRLSVFHVQARERAQSGSGLPAIRPRPARAQRGFPCFVRRPCRCSHLDPGRDAPDLDRTVGDMELETAMKTIRLLATVLLVGLTIGCASISYKPSLSLGTSPSSVHARVQMNQLADASPPDEKETKFAGFAATEPGTLAGDLATEVTNALLTDFSNNQVLDTIQKRMTNPDLVMNGTIHRFYAQSGINALGWSTIMIDFFWLFG